MVLSGTQQCFRVLRMIFSSHFHLWKVLCSLLSVPELQGLSTKYTLGLITVKKAVTSNVSSYNFPLVMFPSVDGENDLENLLTKITSLL